MADVEKSGAIFKVLAAKSPVSWNKLSFWTKAEDTQFESVDRLPDSSNNVQNRLGNIFGITSSLASTDEGMCASSYALTHTVGELCSYKLEVGDWSGPKSYGGSQYYYIDKEVANIILESPFIYLIPSNTGNSMIPTDDEKEAFTNIEMITIGANQIEFLIEDKPDIPITIGVKGIVKKV